jgi:short-subunit dehydrogenase
VRGTGVSVTALCPGPVATEFIEAGGFKNETPGPSFIYSSAEDVARAGIDGADKGKRVVIPGIGNRVQATLGRHSPSAVMLGPVANIYRRVIGE